MKPLETQYVYKKQIGFTLIQKNSLEIIETHGVNVNQFIREAVNEKLKRDWPKIKERKKYCPF